MIFAHQDFRSCVGGFVEFLENLLFSLHEVIFVDRFRLGKVCDFGSKLGFLFADSDYRRSDASVNHLVAVDGLDALEDVVEEADLLRVAKFLH